MPGVLILEALAQAAGILIAQGVDLRDRLALIVSIDGAKIRRPVVPGDRLVLEVTNARIKARAADVTCLASVEGQVAAEARIRFVILDKDKAEAAA
jgi:3-hydroxymyristoyl/3-hydroxydecanoyl-(acyl carrier protein) dehydratase